MSSAAPLTVDLGDLLRQWRRVRSKSQLDLASDAGTTPRYVSFVETGRAQPSRQMVLRLARALDVPLRERNELLLAAGFAPIYAAEPLVSSALARIDEAVTAMLRQHEPFPAVVLDRGWNLQRANDGAASLFGRMYAPSPVPDEANVLRLIIEPGPVREHIGNWEAVVPALLDRARNEAVRGVLDRVTAELVADLRRRSDVSSLLATLEVGPAAAPVVEVQFQIDDTELAFFSVISTVGTPIDVTAQELRIEAFFPADRSTAQRWPALV